MMSDLIDALESPCFDQGFDKTAMATVGEAFVVWVFHTSPCTG